MMKNKEKNFMSAIVYVHNAEDRIEKFLKLIIEVMEENFEHSEIICVNDSSDDNSVSCIKNISKSAKETSISIVNMSYFHGLEVAMNAGIDLSIGDFVFEFDNTTLDFDKEDIMNVYYRALGGSISSVLHQIENRNFHQICFIVYSIDIQIFPIKCIQKVFVY